MELADDAAMQISAMGAFISFSTNANLACLQASKPLNVHWMFTECSLNVHSQNSIGPNWCENCTKSRGWASPPSVKISDRKTENLRLVFSGLLASGCKHTRACGFFWSDLNVPRMFPECSSNVPRLFLNCFSKVLPCVPEASSHSGCTSFMVMSGAPSAAYIPARMLPVFHTDTSRKYKTEDSPCLTSYWSHTESISHVWHPIGRTLSRFSMSDILLAAHWVYIPALVLPVFLTDTLRKYITG
jgi:hypothetical protein